MIKSRHLITLLFVSALTSSCAGPNSPFGALKNTEDRPIQRVPASSAKLPPGLSISFGPKSLIYHKNFDLTVHVSDQEGIENLENLKLYYNDKEVHEFGHDQLEWSLSEDQKKAQLTISGLKLPAHLNHNLSVHYSKNSEVYAKDLQSPKCQMTNGPGLKSLGEFKDHEHMIRMVELLAEKNDFSPSFIVALIGQQSNFDPEYVGPEQRLGLMQIKTSDSFILSNKKDLESWPSYPEIDKATRVGLYTKIMLGLVNSKNEWRIDPEKSLVGGIQYLKNLEDFWKGYDPKERNDLILASYYSDPYKILRVFKTLGKDWRKSDEVASVIPKLREVESHCFELSTASL